MNVLKKPMRLTCSYNHALPKLLWVAECHSDSAFVTCGPCVEITDEFIVAGAWGDSYEAGNLDRTELLVGTGIRFRRDSIVFASPGNTLDRIVYTSLGDTLFASNSLPGLLAVSGLKLIDGHNYQGDLETITRGLHKCTRSIPSNGPDIRLLFFRNLVVGASGFYEEDKPPLNQSFDRFEDYHAFLERAAHEISSNARNPNRRHTVQLASTISSGYDSTVATILAKKNGCRKYFTIQQARSVLPSLDSGEMYASYLGLDVEPYTRYRRDYFDEKAVWASMGSIGDIHLNNFSYPEPLTLLFSGFHGDKVWDRKRHPVDQMQRGDTSGARQAESRIRRGVILLPIPFLGVRNARQIQDISFSEEMRPLSMSNNYDRPIARRIAESAGIPREVFARKKRVSSFATAIPRPYPLSQSLRAEFRQYARSKGHALPSRYKILLYDTLLLLLWNLRKAKIRLRRVETVFFRWDPFPSKWLLFSWAVGDLAREYAGILKRSRN